MENIITNENKEETSELKTTIETELIPKRGKKKTKKQIVYVSAPSEIKPKENQINYTKLSDLELVKNLYSSNIGSRSVNKLHKIVAEHRALTKIEVGELLDKIRPKNNYNRKKVEVVEPQELLQEDNSTDEIEQEIVKKVVRKKNVKKVEIEEPQELEEPQRQTQPITYPQQRTSLWNRNLF